LNLNKKDDISNFLKIEGKDISFQMFSEFAFTYRKGNTFYKEIHGKWYHKNNFYMLNDFHYNSPLRGVSKGLCEHLRALASMRAVRLFLRARAVIKYVLLAASILKNSYGEQRALRKFSGQNLNLSLLKETFCTK